MTTKSIPVTNIIDVAELSLIDANDEMLLDEEQALAMTEAGHTCHLRLAACLACCLELEIEAADLQPGAGGYEYQDYDEDLDD
jgi:hypothetical protein